MRTVVILALLAMSHVSANAQTAAKGVPAPGSVRAIAMRDSALVRLYNGIEVLGEKSVGSSSAHVRVIGTWGGTAGLDCDCILTQVRIAVNTDGDDLRVYALPELLDPTVASIVTEKQNGVVYLDYGPKSARRHLRIEILPRTIAVAEGKPR